MLNLIWSKDAEARNDCQIRDYVDFWIKKHNYEPEKNFYMKVEQDIIISAFRLAVLQNKIAHDQIIIKMPDYEIYLDHDANLSTYPNEMCVKDEILEEILNIKYKWRKNDVEL